MLSISHTKFMVKYDFFKNDGISQYSIVRIITIINNACLIEDINTLKRLWVMKYDIYPINNNHLSGFWEYSKYYNDIYISKY